MLVDKTKDDNYVFLMDWDADKILSFTHICFRGAFVKILIVMIMVITTKSIQRFLSVFFRNCIHTHPKCVTQSACMAMAPSEQCVVKLILWNKWGDVLCEDC